MAIAISIYLGTTMMPKFPKRESIIKRVPKTNNEKKWNNPLSNGKSADDFVAELAPYFTDEEIAERLSKLGFETTINSVLRRRRGAGIKKTGGPHGVSHIIGESPFAKYDNPPVIEADRIVVMPDIQFPYHHAEFMNRVLDLCKALNIKTCIWAGDVIENSSLTHFDPNWGSESLVNGGISDALADELIDAANKIGKKATGEIRKLLEKHGRRIENNPAGVSEEWAFARKEMQKMVGLFERIEWILGNHESRILRDIQSPFFSQDLRRLFVNDKVGISPYYYCILKSGGIEWRVIHPRSSGKGDAKWYAAKFLVNTIMAHNHQWVMQKDKSGKFWGIDTGMMVDERRLPYVAQRDTKQDMHLLGATILIDGKPILLYEDSPWDLLKKIGRMS